MFGSRKPLWNVSTAPGIVVCLLIAAGSTKADFVFGEPVNLGPIVNTPAHDAALGITSDELTIYFDSNRGGGRGSFDVWMTTRSSVTDPWGSPRNVTSINTQHWDGTPSISADGLELYFSSDRPGGYGGLADIWVAKRETISDPWEVPVNLGEAINSSVMDWSPSISADGLELYIGSDRPGGHGSSDIWVAKRSTRDDDWGPPMNLGPAINSPADEFISTTSPDGLFLFVTSARGGGHGSRDIWVSRRSSKEEPWGQAENLGAPFNTAAMDQNPMLSFDGKTFYFATSSGTYGGLDMWQAPVLPLVDFTGEGRVDTEDLTLLIEHWGQNEPAYDMGPTPWGDGVIDGADLEVLMRHWGQDTHFIAHWKLDETGGDIAYDSINENHAAVIGEPIWQREVGQVDGALQLNGEAYLDTQFKLDPSQSSFSVFAWVKGGAPGQVIVSQENNTHWLSTDSKGCLLTELQSGGRRAGGPLVSQAVVTDGNWHRIGLVWDGADRILYVDDIEVVRDTLGGLKASSGDLYIGASSDLQAGTFWQGLIDDIRIYDRVVVP